MNVDNKRLGDIATYINGYAFKPEQWDTNGKPIIRIQNLNNNLAEFNYYNGDINEKYIVNKGDILISWSASIGVYEWQNEEALLNQHIFKVDFNKININKQYFKYVVGIALERAMQFMHGSTMKHITKKYFDDIIIPIPSLSVQYEAVAVLNKSQQLIDKRKEQIETLDELVKSQFIEMFGDLKNEEKLPLEMCTTFIDYRGKTPTLSESGIRIINAKSVGNGFFKYIDEYISEETYNSWMKRGFPVAGDVLFVTEGHTFGNVCRIPSDLNKFAMGQRVITMQGKEGLLNNIFLAQYMQSISFKIDIDKYKTGSSAQGIRSKELQKIHIPIPNIELQNQFDDFVKQVDKLKFEMENSLKELENNFNSLMQRAFKGELFN